MTTTPNTVTAAKYGRGGLAYDYTDEKGRTVHASGGSLARLANDLDAGRFTAAPTADLVDSTMIPEDLVYEWAIRGPMPDATLPPNTYKPLSIPADRLESSIAATIAGNYLGTVGASAVLAAADAPAGVQPWPVPGAVDPFGGAGSLDYVSADVYATIAHDHGAHVEPLTAEALRDCAAHAGREW